MRTRLNKVPFYLKVGDSLGPRPLEEADKSNHEQTQTAIFGFLKVLGYILRGGRLRGQILAQFETPLAGLSAMLEDSPASFDVLRRRLITAWPLVEARHFFQPERGTVLVTPEGAAAIGTFAEGFQVGVGGVLGSAASFHVRCMGEHTLAVAALGVTARGFSMYTDGREARGWAALPPPIADGVGVAFFSFGSVVSAGARPGAPRFARPSVTFGHGDIIGLAPMAGGRLAFLLNGEIRATTPLPPPLDADACVYALIHGRGWALERMDSAYGAAPRRLQWRYGLGPFHSDPHLKPLGLTARAEFSPAAWHRASNARQRGAPIAKEFCCLRVGAGALFSMTAGDLSVVLFPDLSAKLQRGGTVDHISTTRAVAVSRGDRVRISLTCNALRVYHRGAQVKWRVDGDNADALTWPPSAVYSAKKVQIEYGVDHELQFASPYATSHIKRTVFAPWLASGGVAVDGSMKRALLALRSPENRTPVAAGVALLCGAVGQPQPQHRAVTGLLRTVTFCVERIGAIDHPSYRRDHPLYKGMATSGRVGVFIADEAFAAALLAERYEDDPALPLGEAWHCCVFSDGTASRVTRSGARVDKKAFEERISSGTKITVDIEGKSVRFYANGTPLLQEPLPADKALVIGVILTAEAQLVSIGGDALSAHEPFDTWCPFE